MAQRILLLGDITSSHIEKWAVSLAKKGYLIGLFSLSGSNSPWYAEHKNIHVLYEGKNPPGHALLADKLKYMLVLPRLFDCIRSFRPGILHAHYASSYGLLGALSGFHPFVVSVWGSDVYEFPRLSPVHKAILKFNLKKADKILSTSFVMKGELWKYTAKDIDVVPFGIDTDVFYPQDVRHGHDAKTLYIGTIKAMEDKYGIETILEAVHLVKRCIPNVPIRLLLIGRDVNTRQYRKKADLLGLTDSVEFTGKILFSDVPYYHNLLDILLNVSIVNESFGVSVLEGMACEKPVIVSNVPGLREVTDAYGLVVEKENAQQLAKAIIQLINNPTLRRQLGKAAREHVLKNYALAHCVTRMTEIYTALLPQQKEPCIVPVKL